MINIANYQDVKKLLSQAKSIAIVGLSPKEVRPSNMVARYLLAAGYTIYPVNPGHNSILGLDCYAQLSEVPAEIDIVDIFRRSEDVYPIVEQAIEVGAKAVWMQQGVINTDAAMLAQRSGLITVMDRCIKIDHLNLLSS